MKARLRFTSLSQAQTPEEIPNLHQQLLRPIAPFHRDLHFFLRALFRRAMASLRQRGNDNSKASKKRAESPTKVEEARLAPASRTRSDANKSRTRKRRNGFIFFLGGIFGLLAAGFFAQRSDLLEFPELRELSMESLIEVLPAGFVSEARDLVVCFCRSIGSIYDRANLMPTERREGYCQLRCFSGGAEPFRPWGDCEAPRRYGSGCYIYGFRILEYVE
jgi:hypothetical protein